MQPYFLPKVLIWDINSRMRDLVSKQGIPNAILGRGLSATARKDIEIPELVSMVAIVAAHITCTEFFNSQSRKSFRDEVARERRTIDRRLRNPPKRSLRLDVEDSKTARAALDYDARYHWKHDVSTSLSLLWLGYTHKGNKISRVVRPILECSRDSDAVAPTTPRKLYDSLRKRVSRAPRTDLPIAMEQFELIEAKVPTIETTFA